MKTILEYQNEYWYKQTLINEAFSSKILQEIRDQINDIMEANHKYNAENKWSSKATNLTFKSVFSSKWVKWSEIKDEDFTEYDKSSTEGGKIIKQISSNRSNSFSAIVILLNDAEDAPKYKGMIFCEEGNNWYVSFLCDRYGFDSTHFKTGEAPSYFTKKFLVVPLKDLDSWKKHSERASAMSGSFNPLNDATIRENEYKRLAEQNRERYKKYVAKVRAEKDADDGMGEKVNEYVEKIMEITIKISKEPTKYIKHESEVAYLIDLLRDKRTWVSATRHNNGGYYSGTDGLLTVYKSYIKGKLANVKGDSYSFQREEYDKAKAALNEIFKTIDAKIEKFNEAA